MLSSTKNLRRILHTSVALLTVFSSTSYADNFGPNARSTPTRTPIKHIVVFYQENRSFDNYFGTYPNAANIAGEQSWIGVPASEFHALPNTPSVNGLTRELLTNNPNVSKTGSRANPQRLRPADAYTCSMNHAYTAEQKASNGGLMDQFPQATGSTGAGCLPDGSTVMNYYDGNTVTALWNYAQHYAMSDNSFDVNYGPSVPGYINLYSGNLHGLNLYKAETDGSVYKNPADGSMTLIGNTRAYLDDCDGASDPKAVSVEMTGKGIGDLLNTKNVTWGWFRSGFKPTQPAVLNADGSVKTPAVCDLTHATHQYTYNGKTYVVPNPTIHFTNNIYSTSRDYGANAPMYYASTRNPHHLPPSSVVAIGHADQANHNYDISDFFDALKAGHLPSVSIIQPGGFVSGHAGYSDPLMEQAFLVESINAVMQSPEWESTAIIIAYDDSDGWYDHVSPPLQQASNTPIDYKCGNGNPAPGDAYARCGLGPRQPFLVISPWAKTNYVDHTVINQASILAFIEKNWDLGYIDGPWTPLPGLASADRTAGSIEGMFDFNHGPNIKRLILDPIKGTSINE